jgi:hypothetical protein
MWEMNCIMIQRGEVLEKVGMKYLIKTFLIDA